MLPKSPTSGGRGTVDAWTIALAVSVVSAVAAERDDCARSRLLRLRILRLRSLCPTDAASLEARGQLDGDAVGAELGQAGLPPSREWSGSASDARTTPRSATRTVIGDRLQNPA